MSEYLFLLFFPSLCMLSVVFGAWLVFEKIPEIWERIFGECTVMVLDIGETTVEKRRNFDNKLTSSITYPTSSSFLINECCGFSFPAINREECTKREDTDMKTTYEILQETIQIARKLGQIDKKECNLKKLPLQMPEIKGEGEVAELQVRLASINAERKRENEIHQLELEALTFSEKLNSFLWLFEDEKKEK